MRNPRGRRRAGELSRRIGQDIAVARATLGLTLDRAAALARISPTTFASVESGHPAPQLDTLASACEAVGLSLSAKAYPGRSPSLRDTGQLELVAVVRAQAHVVWRTAMEHVVDPRQGRAADLVLFGPDEILHQEFERLVLDWQAQYRSGRVKRQILSEQHQRPVRFVMVVEDTRRNRAAVEAHLEAIRSELPAGSREVWRSIRTGEPLGRDGLLWIRRPPR